VSSEPRLTKVRVSRGVELMTANTRKSMTMKSKRKFPKLGMIRRRLFWRNYRLIMNNVRFSVNPQTIIDGYKIDRIGGTMSI